MTQVKNLGGFKDLLQRILWAIDGAMEVLPSPANKEKELLRHPNLVDFIAAGWRNPAGGYRRHFVIIALMKDGSTFVEYGNTSEPDQFAVGIYNSLQECFDDKITIISYLITAK